MEDIKSSSYLVGLDTYGLIVVKKTGTMVTNSKLTKHLVPDVLELTSIIVADRQ